MVICSFTNHVYESYANKKNKDLSFEYAIIGFRMCLGMFFPVAFIDLGLRRFAVTAVVWLHEYFSCSRFLVLLVEKSGNRKKIKTLGVVSKPKGSKQFMSDFLPRKFDFLFCLKRKQRCAKTFIKYSVETALTAADIPCIRIGQR